MIIERFLLDCRKTKTKVNTLANQRAKPNQFLNYFRQSSENRSRSRLRCFRSKSIIFFIRKMTHPLQSKVKQVHSVDG